MLAGFPEAVVEGGEEQVGRVELPEPDLTDRFAEHTKNFANSNNCYA